jgi:hypothetical protein
MIKVEFDISYDIFESIIVTAFEGGSNYWMDYDESQIPSDPKGEPYTVRIAKKLYEDPDWNIPITDCENGEELGMLNRNNLIKGIQLSPHAFMNVYNEDYDVWDTDVILQNAIMGEIVYG